MNKIDFGGPLALGVCHAKPYTVDMSPPVVYSIDNIWYTWDTSVVLCDFNAT